MYFAFLDVFVERKGDFLITSVYWKLTFTGPYTNWNSFLPKSVKINPISILSHHALMIFSLSRIGEHSLCFCYNGYPANIIERVVVRKVKRFKELVVFGPSLCSVY